MSGESRSARSEPDAGAGEGRQAEAAPLPGSEPVEEPEGTQGNSPRSVLCRMCGQPLRDRASRLWGLGPACRHKLAVRTAPVPPAHEVAQDTLPGL
ncbi:DUF6011 domain-containing protein [Streptomyces tubbatahanensis]|uniref:DUF6011 domain-containing protein n=1 Tax=Streptomyces tubbatahanensis TaxID=2923272 RepID=A0ABY3XMS0_9ACTN|nr:DUF6011 domain-containing protein [Streptomyces tubbatahanensis]UNS95709.1 DUF6011 domain-containing protein [Streptomyces tubbatahanensis]